MDKRRRVVITGMGVVAPNGSNLEAFEEAIKAGKSGIAHYPELAELNFKSQIGGKPHVTEEEKQEKLPSFIANKVKKNGVIFACLAGLEAWNDAGLEINPGAYNHKTGMIIGSGALGLDTPINEQINMIDAGNHRRLGSRSVPESMSSGAGAYLNSILGLTGRVLTNSSACITGSEAILQGYEQIRYGKMERMVCGSTEGDGKYIWAGFDAMRILCSDSNDNPTFGSRPMSSTSSGFVPSGGAGVMILESLEAAEARGAKIYAEIIGGDVNSGGQQNGGTMTAQNPDAVVECIRRSLETAEINANQIDLISGHLTSTKGDPFEIKNWVDALELPRDKFPLVNTPKSMIGHCVAGAGSIETIACALQLSGGFVHPNINLDEVHPDITSLVNEEKLPKQLVKKELDIIIKANFGFGDLNCCLVLKRFNK